MATTQQGYSSRYQKIKTNKLRSLSPSHCEDTSKLSPSRVHTNNHNQTQLGKVVAQLADRVDGIEIKLVNVTNIIKLFQKYTQSKDIQYQKQKQNSEFKRNTHDKISIPESLQVQNKINQIQLLIQRTKAQMTAMESLRVSIQRQNSKKTLCTPEQFQTIPKTLQSPSSHPNTNSVSRQLMGQIEQIMDRMQITLRQEMNKKIDICMSFFKNASQNSTRGQSSPSAVNTIMLQEQLHNATLTMNKIQADCHKNKMIIQAKIEQIVNYVRNLGKNNPQKQTKGYNKQELDQSRLSSISKKSNKRVSKSKSKSVQKSNSKYKKNNTQRSDNMHPSPLPSPSPSPSQKSNKFQQQKRKKQAELKQALRKKKQNQQKLKMKS